MGGVPVTIGYLLCASAATTGRNSSSIVGEASASLKSLSLLPSDVLGRTRYEFRVHQVIATACAAGGAAVLAVFFAILRSSAGALTPRPNLVDTK